MMKKFLAATTAAVICTVAVPYANAQDAESHEGRHHMRGAGHRMNHDEFGAPDRLVKMMTRHLDLDETQSQAIGNILGAAKPEIDALRQRAEESRSAVQALDVDDPDYGSDLQNLSTEIGALTSEATLLHGRVRADVYAQLTQEQRTRATDAHGGMRGGFRRHRMGEPE
jgi:Spy/CpxP family protein refolding chaperone